MFTGGDDDDDDGVFLFLDNKWVGARVGLVYGDSVAGKGKCGIRGGSSLRTNTVHFLFTMSYLSPPSYTL